MVKDEGRGGATPTLDVARGSSGTCNRSDSKDSLFIVFCFPAFCSLYIH